MSMITALVDVRDSNGDSVVLVNPDGTRPTLVLQLGAGFTGTFAKSGDLGIITIGNTTGGEDPTFDSVTATDFVVTGTYTQGPMTIVTGLGTTTGSGSGVILVLPMPDNSAAVIDARFVGRDPVGLGQAVISIDSLAVQVQGGAIVNNDGMPTFPSNTFGLPVAISGVTWAAGFLTITGRGPMATISSAGENAGKVQLQVSGCTAAINATSVDVSGLTNCTEANGTHIATFSDGTTINLNAVTSVHTGADSGTMILTTAPAIRWKTVGQIVIST